MNHSTAYQPLTVDQMLGMPPAGVKLIEASAGTGKTWTITNLYLRYILLGRKVPEVLVVTFTNAATDELRGRIRSRLHQALRAFSDEQVIDDPYLDRLHNDSRLANRLPQDTDRLALAVRSMDEAAIHTIHSFCKQAITEHAFHSGQSFDLELASDDNELWESALQDWWRRNAYPLPRRDFNLFQRALQSLDAFIKLQKPLRHAHETNLLPDTKTPLAMVFTQWHQLETRLRSLGTTWTRRKDELAIILKDTKALSRSGKLPYRKDRLPDLLVHMDDWFGSRDLLEIPDSFYYLTTDALNRHSTTKKRGTDPALEDPFFVDCQKCFDARQSLEQQLRVAALREATDWCSEQVESRKQQQRTLAFHDLQVRLHNALQDPVQGELLAGNLRSHMPVAMIDEFQDTDAIQYGIFRALYHDQPETTLVMIGDPKQAIYRFRGGDIFTYMRARADAGTNCYTLNTNWRSIPKLIEAVNNLFTGRENAFVYDAIRYLPVVAATEQERGAPHAQLTENGAPVVPLTLWKIPLKEDSKTFSKSDATDMVIRSTALEIARLVQGGSENTICIGDTALRPADIAVLVRTGFQGRSLQEALRAHKLRAVTVGSETVYQSAEANGLLLLLQAVINCNDRSLARIALSSNLLGLDYPAISALQHDEHQWLEWVNQLRDLNRRWQSRGFMTMFQSMLSKLRIGQRMAGGKHAERRLTNLLHLAELLQQASRGHTGLDALLGWFRLQLDHSARDEAELRMESDEALIKIVTIHSSKGLEYPVVFAPFLFSCRVPETGCELVAFHDRNGQAFLDASPEAGSASLTMAEKERLAEDVRLAYVALTRARTKLYIAWGPVGRKSGNQCSSGSTALAWLLHPTQTPKDLDTSYPDAFAHGENFDNDLDNLVTAASGAIEITSLPSADELVAPGSDIATRYTLAAAEFHGTIATDWRISSFSSLTRDVHQMPHGGSPRSGHDPILDFAAGSHVGLFLHLLLEKLDFQAAAETQTRKLTKELAPRFNLDPDSISDTLVQWVTNLLDTGLDDHDLRLRELSCQQRLNELEFDFTSGTFDVDVINHLLDDAAGQELEKISGEGFRGMVTGIIDLVFEYRGQFYIADYKSNFLGGNLDDYTPEKLHQAIFDRRYDLQYLLYTLALHRYLRQRISDYRYSEHFGGIYYLFLRGMRPQHGPARGVFHTRPDEALVTRLDNHLLAGEPGVMTI